MTCPGAFPRSIVCGTGATTSEATDHHTSERCAVIEIRLGPSDVANVRFATNAVWDVAASLHALRRPQVTSVSRRMRSLREAAPATELSLLLDLTRIPGWTPDILAPSPTATDARSVSSQLRAIQDGDRAVAEGDLQVLRRHLPGSPLAGMSAERYAEVVSTAAVAYWRVALAPLWERVEAVAEGDLVHRQRTLVGDGVGATLAALHPAIRYGGDTLSLDLPRHRCAPRPDGRVIWLVPSAFRQPTVAMSVHGADALVISYPARGAATVWDTRRQAAAGLASLVGRSRTAILEDLDTPRTTTMLATRLGLSPATVSAHLSTLKANGLLTARRDGRRVLYSRTAKAVRLLDDGSLRDRVV